jgi:hypothetical protein
MNGTEMKWSVGAAQRNRKWNRMKVKWMNL